MPINEELYGAASFFRLPPDASGKRAQAFRHAHLAYTNGTVVIEVDTEVVGVTSGARGAVSAIGPNNSVSSGEFVVVYGPANAGASFAAGEPLQIAGQQVATVDEAVDFFTTANMIAGANNPHNAMFVDRHGAAYVRFSEGEQQLDGFGLSRMTSPMLVGFYEYHYDEMPEEWSDDTSGTASLTHLPDEAAIALDIGTAAGDRYTRTTNKYHLYQPGYSQLAEFTMVSGDAGKAGVRRRGGYYDDNNGVYFELDGTDLYVVLRSSTSGAVVETRIPQGEWNGDVLDGSGTLENLSGVQIDMSHLNVFWIDLQWLGAGRVRFGILSPTGARVTCHTFENANANTSAYMATATLPLRMEIENTGVSGSPSRIKMVCGSVKTEGDLLPDRKKKTAKWGLTGSIITVGDTELPVMSFRSRQVFANGVVNRMVAVPELWSVWVKGDPIILRFYFDGVLTGASFFPYDASSVELDVSASAMSGGHMLLSHMYDQGVHHLEAPSNFGYLGQHARLDADGVTARPWTVTAQLIETGVGGSAQARMSFSWIDIT